MKGGLSPVQKSIVTHPIPPTWDENSEVLILGSFPSVKSRETGYFYGHPQNRFWRVLASVCHDRCPDAIPDKQAFLLRNHIAVWDVIASCEITGSSDSSIQHASANDIGFLLHETSIRRIFCNGKTAYRLYNRFLLPSTGTGAVCLPSTSPANAAWSFDRLVDAWKIIRINDADSVLNG